MIRFLIDLYMLVLVADTVLSYFPNFQHETWRKKLKKAADITCDPIRKNLPPDLPFDLSPLIVILVLQLLIWLW